METEKLMTQRHLKDFTLINSEKIHYQINSKELIESTLCQQQGKLSDNGALVVKTGRFTGRSPKDKFIVRDGYTDKSVYWNDFNLEIEEKYFDAIYRRMMESAQQRELWVRDVKVCADPAYNINVRVINDTPWANLFSYNMFLRPSENELADFDPEWKIIQLSSFKANPDIEGVRSENFSIINFSKKIILIGGTAYTGEIKKGMFTVLNYLLPLHQKVLSMHCSANIGKKGDTALFFGLSGTGKTTLSADPERNLIGDDEHGWSDKGVFNFEGGCYAKCFGLNKEQEPQIFETIKSGALVENVEFYPESDSIDFDNISITENTRVSYPLTFVKNAVIPSIGNMPKNIFFLSCDAYGILPPVSKLTVSQAMYYFLSGYTAKVAGTESGITEPVSTFSACFGAPFLPLNPFQYAEILAQKIADHSTKVWLINTGWIGGCYGIGKRISLKHTRSIINTILEGDLSNASYFEHPIFKIAVPISCPNVPDHILNPRNNWEDKDQYDIKANELAAKFIRNFAKYDVFHKSEIKEAGPCINSQIK